MTITEFIQTQVLLPRLNGRGSRAKVRAKVAEAEQEELFEE